MFLRRWAPMYIAFTSAPHLYQLLSGAAHEGGVTR